MVKYKLVGQDDSLNLVAVRVTADSITSNISLATVRVILPNCCRSRTTSRKW